MSPERIETKLKQITDLHFNVFYSQFEIPKEKMLRLARETFEQVEPHGEIPDHMDPDELRLGAVNAVFFRSATHIVHCMNPSPPVAALIQAYGWRVEEAIELACLAGVQIDSLSEVSDDLLQDVANFVNDNGEQKLDAMFGEEAQNWEVRSN